MSRAPLAALGLTILYVVAPTSAAPRQGGNFSAAVELVRVPVVVVDRSGVPVSGLKPEDFLVTEDGRPQEIASFTEGPPGEAVPLHLGLALDKSISMETALPDAAEAAVTFINTMEEAADVTLLEFEAAVRVSRFAPSAYPQLFERIRDRKIGYGTVLYDAVARYLTEAEAYSGQHVLVVFTDGGDSRSTRTLSQVINALRRGNTIVYAIAYMNQPASDGGVMSRASLSRMARETGGDVFFPGSPRDVARIYQRIRGEVARRYTIGYVAPSAASAPRGRDQFHRVSVRVAKPGLSGVVVRSRSGYVVSAPSRAGS